MNWFNYHGWLTGRCPYGWSLLGSKCYEFIINQNRLLTWTSANEFCVAQGAKMLKIETLVTLRL